MGSYYTEPVTVYGWQWQSFGAHSIHRLAEGILQEPMLGLLPDNGYDMISQTTNAKTCDDGWTNIAGGMGGS